MADQYLPFEERLQELEQALAAPGDDTERGRLQAAVEKELTSVYQDLTPWQRVQLARHPNRPRMLDFMHQILDDFVELHGDRAIGDDPAMICGIGRFRGRTVFVVGQQKGVTTDEKVLRNFGMAHPSGYRKALRIFRMAERLGLPVLSFVDTPAAHPGIEAEQRGQGLAIAENLLALSSLKTPVMAVVLSEGGSGGALGIALADWVAMFEYAVYMICPPERCAEILWRDVDRKEDAAEALRVSAGELLELGIIDQVLVEPEAPAHRNLAGAAAELGDAVACFLDECDQGHWTPEKRQARYQRMGAWEEIAATNLAGDAKDDEEGGAESSGGDTADPGAAAGLA